MLVYHTATKIKKALEAAESHADLGLELFLPSCNEVMSALGENGAGSAGDESGPASAGDVLRRMYTLLDVMCRAGVRPDAKTAEIMASAALKGVEGGAEASQAVLEEFRTNGIVIDAAVWDAVLASNASVTSTEGSDSGAATGMASDVDEGANQGDEKV